jgi:hypothetical protein
MMVSGWEITEWAVAIGAFLTSVGIIWQKVLRPTRDLLFRIEHSLKYVETELRFNGGTTARDALERVEKSLAAADRRMRRIEQHLNLPDDVV